jgi:hypothetical protein
MSDYESIYLEEMKRIQKKLEENKNRAGYKKEYWHGYEKGIKRIYLGSEAVEDKIHNKLLKLMEDKNNLQTSNPNAERFKQLGKGYIKGLKYAKRNLILNDTENNKKRGRPGISKEKTKMVGSRIPISQYEELHKRVKNSSKWLRGLIEQELSKKELPEE